MKRAKHEALKIAQALGHSLTPFAPYGEKEYAYCQNPSCKARLIVEGPRVEGYALVHLCPFLETDTRNGA